MSSHSDSFVSSGTSPSKRRALTQKKAAAVVVDPNQSLLKITEVAAICRVSVSCVRAWRFARKIPFVQLNRKNLLFRRTDVEAFIERNTVTARQVRA
jgi:excisionase family DNA binding protein